jgi:hypothetical protein
MVREKGWGESIETFELCKKRWENSPRNGLKFIPPGWQTVRDVFDFYT